MQRPLYLDYAATTPMDTRVREAMWSYLTLDGEFGNPSSIHAYGSAAMHAVDIARMQVAQLIGATPQEIIWTSGATEANNLALKGSAYFYQSKKKHIITVKTEHKSVLDPCYALAEQGFRVEMLTPQKNGLIPLQDLMMSICDDTLLVSIMHVNNELGVIQDIHQIGALTRKMGILLHVDAAQSAGRVPIDVAAMNIDLLSLSAHKMYGPKGMGALYVRRKPRVRLTPLMHGGGQEHGLRPGTLPTHQIVGMGVAAEIALQALPEEMPRLARLRDELWQQLKVIPGIDLNTDFAHAAANYLNVSIADVDGEALLHALPGLALSMGSACTSAQYTPSHVLKAIGVSDALAMSTLRMTIGRFTSEDEILSASMAIKNAVLHLRQDRL